MLKTFSSENRLYRTITQGDTVIRRKDGVKGMVERRPNNSPLVKVTWCDFTWQWVDADLVDAIRNDKPYFGR